MPTATTPFGKELIRPVKRPQQKKAAKRRKKVMGLLKAFVGPRNLEQALDHAVPPPPSPRVVLSLYSSPPG